jgi:hypothetical protein
MHIPLDSVIQMLDTQGGEIVRVALESSTNLGIHIGVVFHLEGSWHTQSYFVSRRHSAYYKIFALVYK